MFGSDYVQNGRGHGSVGQVLGEEMFFDPGMRRPYLISEGGRNIPYVTINTHKYKYNTKTGKDEPIYRAIPVSALQKRGINQPVWNATSMRKEDWSFLDKKVVMATRQRLGAWDALAAKVSVGGFDAMSKMVYEYEAMSDPGEAVVDIDALSDGRTDAPLFKLRAVPLPITHSDFWFSQRRILNSNNGGSPLTTVMPEAAGRRCGEMVERTVIGTETGVTFGTQATGQFAHDGPSTVYGMTNFIGRVTKTDLTTPDGTNPDSVLQDLIEMRETMYTNGFFGPFALFYSTSYDQWLDRTHFVGTFAQGLTTAAKTLREALKGIAGIESMTRLDYLTSGYQMILIQLDSTVVEVIDGMPFTTVQWDSLGGLRKNWKVLGIQVPLFKMPYNGVAGIIHGTTS